MKCALPLAIAALALAPDPAAAGAWLRGEGAGFLSWSVKIQDDDNAATYGTLYAEYGLNADLTAGLDLGSDEWGQHKALAFVVMPLSREGLNITFELGAGVIDFEPAMRPGLSVGRGIKLAGLGGWWSVDTRAAIRPDDVDLAIDATLGVTLDGGTMLIAQLQESGPLLTPDTLRLTGSAVWESAPERHIEVGLSTGLHNGEDFGVKMGLWRDF